MRGISIGKHVVPLWLIAVILTSGISGVLGYYIWKTFTVQVEIKEPIEILHYPSSLSLYPGETKEFNVTVLNSANVNYFVLLIYTMNDSDYQDKFATFKDDTFRVVPGQQDLVTWISVAPEASATNSTLTVELERVGSGVQVFLDDFNGGNLENWTARQGSWSAVYGQYYVSAGLVETCISMVSALNLTDYSIEADVIFKDSGTGFDAGIVFRYVDNQNYYSFDLSREYGCANLRKCNPSDPEIGVGLASLAEGSYSVQYYTDYLIKIIVQNNNYTCFINNQRVLSAMDSSYLIGGVGLRARNADVLFDNFKVTPLS